MYIIVYLGIVLIIDAASIEYPPNLRSILAEKPEVKDISTAPEITAERIRK